MSSDVSLEQPRSGESFATQVALAWKSVSANVHLQCTQRHVFLLTELAYERLLVLTCTVELKVFRETREGRVRLVAVRTLVANTSINVRGNNGLSTWRQTAT